MAGTLCLNWFQSDKKHFFKRLLLLIPAAVITYGMIWNALQNDSALRFYFFAYMLPLRYLGIIRHLMAKLGKSRTGLFRDDSRTLRRGYCHNGRRNE